MATLLFCIYANFIFYSSLIQTELSNMPLLVLLLFLVVGNAILLLLFSVFVKPFPCKNVFTSLYEFLDRKFSLSLLRK